MLARRLMQLDARAAAQVNAFSRRWPPVRGVTRAAAGSLATAEVVCLCVVAYRGHHAVALRILSGVAVVYVASEVLGRLWRRQRPFLGPGVVENLLHHDPGRSFPSRHVASAVAMAALARSAEPALADLMRLFAWLLAISRVAAGLHYPSDVLGGALLGSLVARAVHGVATR